MNAVLNLGEGAPDSHRPPPPVVMYFVSERILYEMGSGYRLHSSGALFHVVIFFIFLF